MQAALLQLGEVVNAGHVGDSTSAVAAAVSTTTATWSTTTTAWSTGGLWGSTISWGRGWATLTAGLEATTTAGRLARLERAATEVETSVHVHLCGAALRGTLLGLAGSLNAPSMKKKRRA